MLKVCCAIIEYNSKVLVAQRPQGKLVPLKWEFPGGKVEPGESTIACIVREIKEELQMDVEVVKELTPVVHHYEDFSLELIPFVCRVSSEHYHAYEHSKVEWATVEQLPFYDWAEADIPIMKEYILQKL